MTARKGLQRSEKCHKGIERCEKKEELVLEKHRLPDYFATAREAYKSLACRNLCTITLLLLCLDTGPAVRILGNIGALQKY